MMVAPDHYKQISEGYEDQNRFDILMKVGMTRKEVKQSINSAGADGILPAACHSGNPSCFCIPADL